MAAVKRTRGPPQIPACPDENPRIRRDQRSLRSATAPCRPPLLALLRSRSSRTDIKTLFALRFRLKFGSATFRFELHSTKRSVPSLRCTPPANIQTEAALAFGVPQYGHFKPSEEFSY